MGGIWTGRFWKDTAERAIKTFAQSLAAALSAGATGILAMAWTQALSIAGLATLLSVLTSVSGMNVGQRGTASMVPAGPAMPEPAAPVGGPATA